MRVCVIELVYIERECERETFVHSPLVKTDVFSHVSVLNSCQKKISHPLQFCSMFTPVSHTQNLDRLQDLLCMGSSSFSSKIKKNRSVRRGWFSSNNNWLYTYLTKFFFLWILSWCLSVSSSVYKYHYYLFLSRFPPMAFMSFLFPKTNKNTVLPECSHTSTDFLFVINYFSPVWTTLLMVLYSKNLLQP